MFCAYMTSFYILSNPEFADIIFLIVFALSCFYMFRSFQKETKEQRLLTTVIGLLCLISIIFWSFYFQMFMSLTLFISRSVQNSIAGFDFPAPYYVGVQSIGMLLFGLVLTRNKEKLTRSQSATRAIDKFTLSITVMFFAYGLINVVIKSSVTSYAMISPLYIIPSYLLISVAELLLSPIGLAAVTTLSHRSRVSTMMGIFFVSLGLGGFLSGKLAALTAIPDESIRTLPQIKLLYSNSFFRIQVLLGIAALLSLLINRLCRLTLKQFDFFLRYSSSK